MASGVTTEWDDIQVKMGNYLPREQGPTTEEVFQTNLEQVEEIDEFKGKQNKKLQEMVEDDPDLEDDDEFMEIYRQKRLEELKQEVAKPRYGDLIEIQRPEFEVQVTRAPKDVIVVISLYQDYVQESLLLNEILARTAKKNPYVKFIKIIANRCIENYLDIDVPGLLFYKNGDLMDKIIPAAPVFGGKQMNQDTVEFVLAMKHIIEMEFEEDPREKLHLMKMQIQQKGKKRNEDESDEDEDDREYVNNQMFRYKH